MRTGTLLPTIIAYYCKRTLSIYYNIDLDGTILGFINLFLLE